ncbi:hypothetical protein D3C76_1751570 [compost metagenome]
MIVASIRSATVDSGEGVGVLIWPPDPPPLLFAVITIVNSIVSMPAWLEAVTVNLYVPASVGTPEITPVAPSNFNPAGK